MIKGYYISSLVSVPKQFLAHIGPNHRSAVMTRISLLALIASAIIAPAAAEAACSAANPNSTTISSVLNRVNGVTVAHPTQVSLTQYAGGIADYADGDSACVRMGILSANNQGIQFGNAGGDLFVLIKDGKVASVAHISGVLYTN